MRWGRVPDQSLRRAATSQYGDGHFDQKAASAISGQRRSNDPSRPCENPGRAIVVVGGVTPRAAEQGSAAVGAGGMKDDFRAIPGSGLHRGTWRDCFGFLRLEQALSNRSVHSPVSSVSSSIQTATFGLVML